MKTPRLKATHLIRKYLYFFLTVRNIMFCLTSGKNTHIWKIPGILIAITEPLAINTAEPSSKHHTCLEEHTHKSIIWTLVGFTPSLQEKNVYVQKKKNLAAFPSLISFVKCLRYDFHVNFPISHFSFFIFHFNYLLKNWERHNDCVQIPLNSTNIYWCFIRSEACRALRNSTLASTHPLHTYHRHP